MGKNCKFVYYDKNGNLSDTYYSALSEHGEDVAAELYLKEMLSVIEPNVKYSSASKPKFGESVGSEKLEELGYARVSSISSGLTKDSNEVSEAIAANTAINLKARDEFKKNKSGDWWELKKEAADFFKYDYKTNKANANLEIFELYKKDAKNRNTLATDIGTEEHAFFEEIFNARFEASDPDYFESFASEGIKSFNSVYPDSSLNAKTKLKLEAVAKDIFKKSLELEKQHGVKFELRSEYEIKSDKVKFNGKPISGHIDLMLYSPELNAAHLIDYKTKDAKSYDNIRESFNKTMSPPFSNVDNTPLNKVSIQNGIYGLMLKEEHDMTILGSSVAWIVSEFKEDSTAPGENIGDREWSVVDIQSYKIEELSTMSGAIAKALDIKSRKSTMDSSEEVIAKMFDNKLMTSVGSKENFINGQESAIKQTKDGKYRWFNNFKKESIIRDTKEDVISAIKDNYDEYEKMKSKAAPDLVQYFRDGKIPKNSIWNSGKLKQSAISLLLRFSKDAYELFTSVDIEGISNDVVVAVNKNTGETTLISIAPTYNTKYVFNEEGDKARTSLFGPFMDDEAVNAEFRGDEIVPDADVHSLGGLNLALIAAKLKDTDPKRFSKITELVTTTLKDDYNAYQYTSMKYQLAKLKQIKLLMEKNGQLVPKELVKILEDKELKNDKNYETDYFAAFVDTINSGMDPMKKLVLKYDHIKDKDIAYVRNALKETLNEFKNEKYDQTLYYKIERDLKKYIQEVYMMLLSELGSPEAVRVSPIFIAANRAMLSFKGFMVTENTKFKGHVLGQMNSLTTVGDEAAEALELSITQYEQRARDELVDMMAEHQKLQKDLMKESGVSTVENVLSADTFKKVFKDMLEDGYEFDSSNVNKWMRFKHPDKLKGAQKAYVIFYNKMVKQAAKKLFPSKINLMYPDEAPDGYSIPKWEEGQIPIIPGSLTSALSQVDMSKAGLEGSMGVIKKLLKGFNKTDDEKEENTLTPWNFSSIFIDQVDSTQGRGSSKTRKLLNITDGNEVIEDKRDIEMNPAVVLNMMMLESVRKEHMTMSSFISFAMDAELAYKNTFPGVNSAPLRKLMSNITLARIHGKVKNEGKIAAVIDMTKRMASMGLFMFSTSQVATETTTSGVQIASQLTANGFNKMLFKRANKYDAKDQKWSMGMVAKPFGRQVTNDLGLFNTNLNTFLDDDLIETKKLAALQTKHGFKAIDLILRQSSQSIILAQMHKEGITQKAYDYDEKTGRYTYNELKDTRFYVYDKALKLDGQEPKAPETEDEINRNLLWLAHRKKLLSEGGINITNNKMTRPFTIEHIRAMKAYSIKLIGAMDNSEIQSFEVEALGRAAATFKRWIRQKAANYWTPTYKSFKEGTWEIITDEHGNKQADFIKKDIEGIAQSVFGIYKDIKDLGYTDAIKKASDIRLANLSKLLADLLMGVLLWELVILSDEFGDLLLKDEVTHGMNNALSDIVPLMSIDGVISGSPLAAVSIVLNTTKSTLTGIGYALTGNLDNAYNAADNTMGVFGGYRTGKSFVDLLVEFDK